MERIETTILRNLVFNEEFARKTIPFIEPDFFEQRTDKILFEEIVSFITKYDTCATIEALNIEVENRTDLTAEEVKQINDTSKELNDTPVDNQWLLDITEKWCRDRAIYLALMESIHIADGEDDKKNRDAIPSILSDALAVSFDNNIGHDYILNSDERYEYYHKTEDKIPFDLEYFNKITKGGLPNKTLNIALAGTGVGKSLFMCHFASSVLLQGRNVLYITMEMAEEKIAERIDANLLNVDIQQLAQLPKMMFENKITALSKKTQGKLIVKEYPTASAHAGHFRALLNDLALKKAFRPEVIFIDYLNICTSQRFRNASGINSYTMVKSIAEELRGLAVEFNVPLVSATQTTRSGYGSSDVDLTDTSESFGLPATADLMFALISTEELEEQNQIMVKQLKNRYYDPTLNKRFVVGIDRAKMRLYNVEQEAQNNIMDSGQVVLNQETVKALTQSKTKFNDFKF